MKFEFSAGGIVFKNEKDDILILVAQHSQHHGWVFPKGLIDQGETKEQAAIREVREETGINAKILKPLTPVTYWYVFKGDPSTGSGQVKIKKTVYYFVMECVSGDINDHDLEMEAVEWIPSEKVENRLTYKSDKMAWLEAMKLIGIK
jgi:8-oxo-dGTP diphosphatase